MTPHPVVSSDAIVKSTGQIVSGVDYQKENSYCAFLAGHNLQYFEEGYYWKVGTPCQTHGWILHLSAIHCQVARLLETIIPILATNPIPFKIIRDEATAKSMMAGSLGFAQVGKMVCIYPFDDDEALYWAKRMIDLTKHFRGPQIPATFHLGSIMYTSYGSFQSSTDSYNHIAFKIPKAKSWPYKEITKPIVPAKGKILKQSYYLLTKLKPDVKGDVSIALYFKKPWQLKTCLIKEGIANMIADEEGRDIQDRLYWQYQLYQDLHKKITLPAILDYFNAHGNSYLVMEYIKGASITQWVRIIYQTRTWIDLSTQLKTVVLNLYVQLLDLVSCLHDNGYIHRDLNDSNFIINSQGKIYPIDLELVWNQRTGYPQPPFALGTPGFSSHQQLSKDIPTVKDDIYALGGLLILLTTGLFPTILHNGSSEKIYHQLLFFTQNPNLSHLMSDCRHTDPTRRPSLIQLRKTIENLLHDLQNTSIIQRSKTQILDKISTEELNAVIRAGIHGLTHRSMLNDQYCWISPTQLEENHIGNEQIEKKTYIGWHTGISGPLWLLAKAKKLGLVVEDKYNAYQHSWDFVQINLLDSENKDPGLYTGSAGVALALIEGLDASLLLSDQGTARLQGCFQNMASGLNLSSGVAGQGLSLLRSKQWIENKFLNTKLMEYLEIILNAQHPDGSWNCPAKTSKKGDLFIGLDNGVSGVVLFLLTAWEHRSNSRLESAIKKGIAWIINRASLKKGFYDWPVSTKNKDSDLLKTSYGMPGILLVLIKAYECFGYSQYRQIIESTLYVIPERPVLWDISLASGISGLGELYLEAYRVFQNPIWFQRATWIMQTLIHLFREERTNLGCWVTGITGYATADLFTGNGGPQYFLMHYTQPNTLMHPLYQ